MADIRTNLAQFITEADAGNQLSPGQLGYTVGVWLREQGFVTDEATADAVADFVETANAGVGYLHPKRLTGRVLADAIVDEFKLADEVPC